VDQTILLSIYNNTDGAWPQGLCQGLNQGLCQGLMPGATVAVATVVHLVSNLQRQDYEKGIINVPLQDFLAFDCMPMAGKRGERCLSSQTGRLACAPMQCSPEGKVLVNGEPCDASMFFNS
jgi:hypothetical protein